MSKCFVVWVGRIPGVYTDINDMLEQTDDFPGASFKSYDSPEEAAIAFRRGTAQTDGLEVANLLLGAQRGNLPRAGQPDYMTIPEIDLNGWAVDAACSGNPGKMEYRGVDLMTGKELFREGPFYDSTNNIGEFLAIVHALALMFRKGERHTLYSDSKTGMAWVRNRKVKTTLTRNSRNEKSFRMIERALSWLNTHSVDVHVRKWETERWGEIPADFGRK